ncbi:MAG: ribosomal RNA small subunit methyltransferase A [Sedimentisphaerales bacterium]|nr:ribosomal RNA small subunit methyltransferase A [Sedimentisphaerales bacterium]
MSAMQTKSEIRQLLACAGLSPNRRFGQHFLVDLNLMRLAVDAAGITEKDTVLEVGCGTGSLTSALAERAGLVIAVEIDPKLAQIARSHLANTPNVRLVQTDALSSKGTFDPTVVEAAGGRPMPRGGRLLLVANLPYDVASAVMLNLVKGPLVADEMVVTVQKEVAQRMGARPGTRDYGSLSILLGATGTVEMLRVLKPSVFWPPPKVDSALVRFVRDRRRCAQIADIGLLGEVVSLFMGHRRKMLRACTRYAPPELGGGEALARVLARSGLDPTLRPEQLSPEQYVTLADLCRR